MQISLEHTRLKLSYLASFPQFMLSKGHRTILPHYYAEHPMNMQILCFWPDLLLKLLKSIISGDNVLYRMWFLSCLTQSRHFIHSCMFSKGHHTILPHYYAEHQMNMQILCFWPDLLLTLLKSIINGDKVVYRMWFLSCLTQSRHFIHSLGCVWPFDELTGNLIANLGVIIIFLM